MCHDGVMTYKTKDTILFWLIIITLIATCFSVGQLIGNTLVGRTDRMDDLCHNEKHVVRNVRIDLGTLGLTETTVTRTIKVCEGQGS